MKRLLLTLSLAPLVGGAALAQSSALSIPALPLGASSPVAARASVTVPSVTAAPPATSSPAVISAPHLSATTNAAAHELPKVTTLPNGRVALPGTYTVGLTGPRTLQAGQPSSWSFTLGNTGSGPIHLEHGACDVRFEVLNTAGQVVRPDFKNTICTMQLVILDVKPGETREVQKIRWDAKDGSGTPVAAGTYTIRAKLVAGDQFSPAATLSVTVR
ncbi:hypothetical protein [Deinococcus sp.]|uniref:hypothetical protein n=1 Tax=Deinococcus sp. TaxID=47478 RepID=UPI0025C3D316|nr:hypothetical protein [Deinococcus sp.]